ncbi:MAG: DUF721 domain-containing protein [Holophagaceae bacterium]|nr:DUF721 domain-containing protein [Holophagaceae bacterium]
MSAIRPMQPIAEAGLRGAETAAAKLRAEAKIRRAWSLSVGPSLQRHTVFLRLVQGRLVIGAWDLAMIPSLRVSAEATWPQLKERLERFTGLRLTRLELVPTNPPERSIPAPPKPKDAFTQVLARLRDKA